MIKNQEFHPSKEINSILSIVVDSSRIHSKSADVYPSKSYQSEFIDVKQPCSLQPTGSISYASNTELLQSELKSVEELVELEPDSKCK